ncbi:MAG: hypothetical protein ABIR30_01160 [Chitinophagaceae bacterium]
MKLAPLLAQYLYTHKRLDLPGIGSFMLDPHSGPEPVQGKHGKPNNLEGVSFENNSSIRETPELIAFISSHTGKIKALASADLESHLELARQFLNIGKPFLFEGIGNLARIGSGKLTFTAGQALIETMKDISPKETSSNPPMEESKLDYKSIFYHGKEKMSWKKPAAVLLLIAGIGLAVWGGYKMYKKTTAKNDETTAVDEKNEQPVPATVVEPVLNQQDSVIEKPAPAIPATFKYVLEVSDATRAFGRFSRLKTFQWNVQMETKDSLSYKIYMLLPAAAADTTKLLDSLTRLNGKRVYIE